jgi:hypothetical protein
MHILRQIPQNGFASKKMSSKIGIKGDFVPRREGKEKEEGNFIKTFPQNINKKAV